MQLAMAISRREVFFPIIYILVWSRPCLHETTCSLHVTINQTSLNDCSDVFRSTCNQLQAALARVTLNASDLTDGPVCVTLMPGNHFLDYSDTEIEYSVHIVGSRDGDTVLQCSQNESFNNATYEEFPLKFGADTRVLLDRVKFTDCARPLLFNGTASVTVQYCHFRYITSVKIIKNEVRCRDDTVPKTVETRSHCKVWLRACNNLPQPPKKTRCREGVAEDCCMLSTIPCSGFLSLQFLAQCHPYILLHF